ncbi:MAG: TolC family protein [Pseudohongiellaceae bacterium]
MRLLLLFTLSATLVSGLHAEPLTEQQAVLLGLDSGPFADSQQAGRSMARAEAAGIAPRANPSVEYSRETVSLAPGDTEDQFLWLRQRLDLAGINGRRRAAGQQRLQATLLDSEQARREHASRIREWFYAQLAARQRVALTEQRLQRMEQLVTAVAARVEAGDASQYDHLRLQQEAALLESRLTQAVADHEEAANGLAALLGATDPIPRGTLLPPEPDSVLNDELSALMSHPALQSLDARRQAALMNAEAADRQRWPAVTVGVGHRSLSEPGDRGTGNLLMLELEVPIFNRGQHEQAASRSRAHQLDAEQNLLRRQLSARMRSLQQRIQQENNAARALANRLPEGDSGLAAIAEESYRAGEISVMALIDAHSSELALQIEQLERARAARNTYIRWQELTGELP